jgi:hypothetical protein
MEEQNRLLLFYLCHFATLWRGISVFLGERFRVGIRDSVPRQEGQSLALKSAPSLHVTGPL